MEITDTDAWEVLDSRGDPTVRVAIEVDTDHRGVFTVPAGASTGEHEAVEKRDGGTRYDGRGVRQALRAIRTELAPVALGRDPREQSELDAALIERDTTSDLARLGANAVLGVSGAVAHAAADAKDVPLYHHLAEIAPDATPVPEEPSESPGRLPLPMVNILSGGLHAEGSIEIQDFLVVPVGAGSFPEAIEMVWDVRQAVRDHIIDTGYRPLVADEGGFAPPLEAIKDGFDLLEVGVHKAGYESGTDIAFAVDIAASHFYDAEASVYRLESLNRTLNSEEMSDFVAGCIEKYPLVSVEDPLDENDWEGWQHLPKDVQLLGDDLLATNRERLNHAIETNAANAVLVKPNQAGTITRTMRVITEARTAGFAPVVSARSGETCDSTIADLAVALDAGQIKIGSLARSERLAKYNRLLEIAHRTDHEFAHHAFD